MGSFARDRLKRAERAAWRELLEIPQARPDGTVARFPASEGMAAYLNWFERLGAGEDAPPEHPMIAAIRNTSDPEWQKSFLVCEAPDEHARPIPDLSEH